MQVVKRRKLVEKHVYPQNDASACGLGTGDGADDISRERAEHEHFPGRIRSPSMSHGQIEKLSICLIPGGSIRYCHIKLYVVIQDVLWAAWAIEMVRRESSPGNFKVEESSRFCSESVARRYHQGVRDDMSVRRDFLNHHSFLE